MSQANDIFGRLTALEVEVAELRQSQVAPSGIQQLLNYLGRMDANLSEMNQRLSRVQGDVAQFSSRVERIDENVTALREEVGVSEMRCVTCGKRCKLTPLAAWLLLRLSA
ncbi:hypothetical protein DO97_17315 [Neosynechococcus sphagnicola sy1]|uniref:Uncharacterized protein n=1 Tax=Neosynechococcus sphagnicola sy1 TaxID=1497020 RepID=A0A098THW3_9CYAN|nr:hypothetical protein [Neosynechococcus sphagnicola]KGF71601.1 hypothetical protein DO97_17315 [Neosynechococcus sphagnicola sy1]